MDLLTTTLLYEEDTYEWGKKVYSNFRLIAATNRHIPDMVHQGIFREDLYFRLNILSLDRKSVV